MSTLPTGTVTFLFTDIEGSTTLWETHPERMKTALARHDGLLREAIGAGGGHIFETAGDSFAASFSRPVAALDAAIAAQRALATERWEFPGGLRVRMAVHTGTAEERDGNYFGSTLNRTARILSTGHGGQTLLSRAAQDLASGQLPNGVTTRDLGEHRLKDLSRPEHIYQLVIPGLPADFPPLRSLDPFRHNLPLELTSFIGRKREIQEVKQTLAAARLLTLAGTGGAGKTRLSLQIAVEMVEAFRDGVWLVELAALTDPAYVAGAVASVLGVREQPGRPITDTLAEHCRPKSLLLLLDNCEHLLAACADLAEALLRRCPNVKVLATSREPLGVHGEVLYRVPPLSMPDIHRLPPREQLTQYEAIRLFIERAMAVTPAFAVTDQNAPAIAQISYQLDGIPLAIELAASRVKVLSAEQVAARLDDRFRLLTGGARTVLPRHQTLRAALDWSYDLLSEHERVLLQRLSVFAGGCTLDATEVVCAGNGIAAADILDLLSRLVDKSLLSTDEHGGIARYHLLETVRQYGSDRLQETGNMAAARTRHLDHFLALAELGIPPYTRTEQLTWLNRMDEEHDNMRTALAWSLDDGNRERALRLVWGCYYFWNIRGHLTEGREWTRRALAANQGTRSLEMIQAIYAAEALAWRQGDVEVDLLDAGEAMARQRGDPVQIAYVLTGRALGAYTKGEYASGTALLEEGLAAARKAGDEEWIAEIFQSLGFVARHQGQFDRATSLLEESIAIRKRTGNLWPNAHSLHNLALIARRQGDYIRAAHLHGQTLPIFKEFGDKGGVASTQNSLGLIALARGEYDHAAPLFEEALTLFRDLGDKGGIALALMSLGLVALRQGQPAEAETRCRESLTVRKEIGDRRGIADALEGLAAASAGQGDTERAAHLWGAAEALREVIGAPLGPAEQAEYQRAVDVARFRASEQAFRGAWAAGRNMTLEQAVAYALDHPAQ